MSSCAYDPTIRVPKLPTGPVRRLPQQFAPARARRWPRLAAVVVVGVLAVALGGALAFASAGSEEAHRSAQAEELLRMLGR